jgi:hypothetical protein
VEKRIEMGVELFDIETDTNTKFGLRLPKTSNQVLLPDFSRSLLQST